MYSLIFYTPVDGPIDTSEGGVVVVAVRASTKTLVI
jgi:hypothetical protein